MPVTTIICSLKWHLNKQAWKFMGAGSLCWQLHFKLVIRFNEKVFLPRPELFKNPLWTQGCDAQLRPPGPAQVTGHFLQTVGWTCQAMLLGLRKGLRKSGPGWVLSVSGGDTSLQALLCGPPRKSRTVLLSGEGRRWPDNSRDAGALRHIHRSSY